MLNTQHHKTPFINLETTIQALYSCYFSFARISKRRLILYNYRHCGQKLIVSAVKHNDVYINNDYKYLLIAIIVRCKQIAMVAIAICQANMCVHTCDVMNESYIIGW